MFRYLSHASAGFAAALLALAVFAAPVHADGGGGTSPSLCNTECDGREPGGDNRGCCNCHTGCDPTGKPQCDNATCVKAGPDSCNCSVVGT